MTSMTISQFDNALKEVYLPDKVRDLTYAMNPFFALVPKSQDFYGREDNFMVIVTDPQGISNTFANASTNKKPSVFKQFKVTRVRTYGLADIDNETIEASEADVGAFLKARVREIDGLIHGVARAISIALYRDGSGTIGQIATSSAGVITLTNPGDVRNFELGMVLLAGSGSDGLNTKNSGANANSATVVSRSVPDAQVTVDNAPNSFTSNPWSDADFLIRQGDQALAISGMSGWIPSAGATAGTLFAGVDRAIEQGRLAGIHQDYSGIPIKTALQKAARLLAAENSKPSHVFLSPESYTNLEETLGDRVRYTDVETEYPNIGFRAIEVSDGNGGMIKVLQDRNCPARRAFMVQMDDWKLRSLGEVPHLLNRDGTFIRNSGADSYEIRVGFYGNLFCLAPGHQGNFILCA